MGKAGKAKKRASLKKQQILPYARPNERASMMVRCVLCVRSLIDHYTGYRHAGRWSIGVCDESGVGRGRCTVSSGTSTVQSHQPVRALPHRGIYSAVGRCSKGTNASGRQRGPTWI